MKTRLSSILFGPFSALRLPHVLTVDHLNENKTIVNLFLPFFGPSPTACAYLNHLNENKTIVNLCWPFVGPSPTTFAYFNHLNENRTIVNFCWPFFGPFGSKLHLSGVKLDPFRTTKSSTTVSQKKCCANHWIYPLKHTQDARQISVWPFWSPFSFKMHLFRPQC